MDTVVWILILLVSFSFLLKQTFWPWPGVWGAALVAAGFTALAWPYAIEQSRTQIADWLADSALMLDVAVVLTVEVALQMAWCLLSVHVANYAPVTRARRWMWRILFWFPGLLFLPVLFFALTRLIFALPGIPFREVAWLMAVWVLGIVSLGRLVLRRLVPEEELRLELFFLLNALIAVLGVVATVNGRTAVEGTAVVDWPALLGCLGVFLFGAAAGWGWRAVRIRWIRRRISGRADEPMNKILNQGK